jgi:hypothetical protein
MAHRLPLWASVALALATGGLIYRLWPHVGLPPRGGPLDAPFPDLWRWFFTIWLPLLYPAFTLAHRTLARRAAGGLLPAAAARGALAWDRVSYLGLPVFLATMVAWRHLGDWRIALGGLYVLLLAAKALGLVLTLRQAAQSPALSADEAAEEPLARHLFLAAFLLYAFLAPYVATAVSTTGDEHLYLLGTVSLYADHDADIRDNVARGDYARFYWGRPAAAAWRTVQIAFSALLLPGYAAFDLIAPRYPLAGRLGATLTIALFAALLGLETYRLCRDVGVSRPAAFWAWLILALTPPILVNASHLYPEIPAALATVVGFRVLRRAPTRTWRDLAVVMGAAAFLVILKNRYAALGVGLLGGLIWRLARRRPGLALALGAAIGAAAAYIVVANPVPTLFPRLGTPSEVAARSVDWNWDMSRAVAGLFVDQAFGLLFHGPHWALALGGILLLARRAGRTTVALLGLAAFYVVVLVQYRWTQWDAGWTPPPRFLLAVMPLFVPFVAEVFDRARGPVLAAVNTVALAWSGVLAVVLAVVPFWRYNGLTGRARLLGLLADALGLDLARFLPSVRVPVSAGPTAVALGALLLLAGACLLQARRPAAGWGRGAVVLAPGSAAALLTGLAGIWIAAAALTPTGVVLAVAMRHSGGVPFGSYTYDKTLWVMKRDARIEERIVTWPGVTEIAVVAGGFTTTGDAPRMTVLVDGHLVESRPLQAGWRRWQEETYVTRVPTGFGHPTLAIAFEGLLDTPARDGPDRVQHAYVDRIRLRRLAASP